MREFDQGARFNSSPESNSFSLGLQRFRELELISFGSRSERACGITLEAFLAGWRIVPGETFQVPIGANRHVDYVMPDSAILEWHPPDLRSGFRDKRAGQDFLEVLRRVNRHTAERLIDIQKKEITAVYRMLRRKDIDYLPENRGKDLIVVTGFSELYELAIRRYCSTPPSFEEARRVFTEAFPPRRRYD